ncbi:TetR family transcriptional regulator [Skermania sp. ID1734]|uniref:TetR family transcriptional regulator n=1 Tax=Skermania sp. ID1734 TaxID=2597516 RepID=UPI00351BE8DB
MTTPETRAEKKERTRRALLDGTLELTKDSSFASVSLREIARSAGIVPTAFYRHFSSLEELALALVDEGMRALRLMLREARRSPGPANAHASLEILIRHVRANPELFRFLYRERYGGPPEVRRAIRTEIGLIVRDLTIDLSRIMDLRDWPTEDLQMAADLIVTTMTQAMAEFLDADDPRSEEDVALRTERQMRLIILGMAGWRPKPD